MRDRAFLEAFLDEVGKGDPHDLDAAAIRAGKRCNLAHSRGVPTHNPRALLKRAAVILSRPDVAAAIRDYFGIAANFTPDTAARKLTEHIEGIVWTDAKGNLQRQAPSLEALKLYLSLTLPKPAKQVQVDQRTLIARVAFGAEPPRTLPRTLEKLPPTSPQE